METVTYQTDQHVGIIARAQLVSEDGDGLKAWAEHHVRRDPDIRWILGNFVEADDMAAWPGAYAANNNGHIFPLDGLMAGGVDSVQLKPLNMLHHERYMVGAFAGASMITPPPAAAGATARPIMEALSAFWQHLFPEELALVDRAHKDGSLFYSMECQPESLTCPSCEQTYPFAGIIHDSYCSHLNASRISPKRLDKPHFNAGALILPPVQPGWSRADIHALSKLVEQNAEEAESIYASLQAQSQHLTPQAWEEMMLLVMAHSHA